MYNFIHGWTIKYQTKFLETKKKWEQKIFLQRRQLMGGPNFFSIYFRDCHYLANLGYSGQLKAVR